MKFKGYLRSLFLFKPLLLPLFSISGKNKKNYAIFNLDEHNFIEENNKNVKIGNILGRHQAFMHTVHKRRKQLHG